jgi:hypothetical protein
MELFKQIKSLDLNSRPARHTIGSSASSSFVQFV